MVKETRLSGFAPGKDRAKVSDRLAKRASIITDCYVMKWLGGLVAL